MKHNIAKTIVAWALVLVVTSILAVLAVIADIVYYAHKAFKFIGSHVDQFMAIALVFLMGCAMTPHAACVAGYMGSGAAISELGLMTGATISSCNGDCMQHKIEAGESVSQAVHHSVRQRNDIITYTSPVAVGIGALLGWGVGEYMCEDVE